MKHACMILFGFFLLDAQPRPVVVTPAGQVAAQSKAAASAPAALPIAKPAAPKTTPASASSDDRAIEAKLRAKLSKSKVGADGFTFQVRDGVVTWEGETDIGQHKGAATRMAKTAGAHAVVNNIAVHGGKSRGMVRSAARSEAR